MSLMGKRHQNDIIAIMAVHVVKNIRKHEKQSGQIGPVILSYDLMRSVTDIEKFREGLKEELAMLMPDFNISRNLTEEKQQDEAHTFYSWCISFSKK